MTSHLKPRDTSKRRINPNKLLLSKWTAATPQNKERHFMVTKIIPPQNENGPIEHIELLAIYSQRREILHWRELENHVQWSQGWLS
ncbi:MAG: TIGR02450 family Trp-rich protein [Methylococcaceae bacterium]|jgi:tryptophan-rich conserved hypothetical protein